MSVELEPSPMRADATKGETQSLGIKPPLALQAGERFFR